jgi:hypothetical protein
MRSWLSCLAILSLAPVSLRGQVQPIIQAALEGDVVNSATSVPIAGVRLKLEREEFEPIFTKTDEQGHFRFARVAPATYNFAADGAGLLPPKQQRIDFSTTALSG